MRFYRPLGQISALTFDLDDTLYDNREVILRTEQESLAFVQNYHPALKTMQNKDFQKLRQSLRETEPDIYHDVTEWRRRAVEQAMLNVGLSAQDAAIGAEAAMEREMMPLIRYRTRDLTRILPGTCPCGRTHLRIDRIKGRSDDMFIIKGVNIFPMQVEKVLVQFPELGSNYLITLETISNQDEIIVEVELSDLSTDNYIELEKIRKAISRQLKDEILVTPKVKLVKKGSLPQSEGKAVRVKDLRDNK